MDLKLFGNIRRHILPFAWSCVWSMPRGAALVEPSLWEHCLQQCFLTARTQTLGIRAHNPRPLPPQLTQHSTGLFSLTKLKGPGRIRQSLRQTTWQRILGCLKLLSLLCRPQVVQTRWTSHRHSDILLELFYMLEVCCGSGASSRAMIMYMRRMGRGGGSLLIDIMTLDLLLLMYPELKPYLEDGSIIYFEACLTQM